MTRAKAIERAFIAWKRPENQIEDAFGVAYDVALIAGLRKAVQIQTKMLKGPPFSYKEYKDAIRAEITQLQKGAKAK